MQTGKTIKLPGKPFHSADPTHNKLTPKQASAETGYAEATIRDWLDKGKLTKHNIPISPGNKKTRIYVDQTELLKYVEDAPKRPDTRIIWNMDERHRISEEFAVLRLDDPFTGTGKLLDSAIERSLPPERHRKDFQLANDPALKKLLLEHFEEAKEMLYGAPDPVLLTSEPVIQERTVIDVTQSLNSASLSELCGTAVKRLIEELPGVVPSGIPTPNQELPASCPLQTIPIEPAQEPRTSPFRVAVGGLLPRQFHTLSQKIPSGVELVLLKNDRDASPKTPQVDYVVMNSKFVSHSMVEKTKSSGERLVYITGGINAALHKIVELRSQHLARAGQIKLA